MAPKTYWCHWYGIPAIVIKVPSGGRQSLSKQFKWKATYKAFAFFTFVGSLLLRAPILKALVHEQIEL